MQRTETGNYYYGARDYDPKISVWLSVDPMAHKYPSLSPYVFTGNNPIMLVDPDGRQIDPASQDEWASRKQDIQSTRDIVASMLADSPTDELFERLASLDKTLQGMETMEDPNNSTNYILDGLSAEYGLTHMDDNGNIHIEFDGTTGNFVHEVQHGIQFEENTIGFFPGKETSISSFQNEIDAYQAEIAYSGYLSKPGAGRTESIFGVDLGYVKSISLDGSPFYSPNTFSPIPIHADMGYRDMQIAFPSEHAKLPFRPGETPRRTFKNVVWK